MLSIGDGLFVHVPNESNKRILHPAKVVGLEGDLRTAELEETDLAVEAGQDLIVYYDWKHDFVQQTARISAVIRTEPTPVIGFETTGEPVSAESRQCYRVSTLMSDLTVLIGDGEPCPLVDVSATGFSMMTDTPYKIGQMVSATLQFEDEQFPGKACIQSAKELGKNRTRYGLHCVNDRAVGRDLERGLLHISTAVQRQQLSRQSRSRAG